MVDVDWTIANNLADGTIEDTVRLEVGPEVSADSRFTASRAVSILAPLNLLGRAPIDRMEIPFSLSAMEQVGDIRIRGESVVSHGSEAEGRKK